MIARKCLAECNHDSSDATITAAAAATTEYIRPKNNAKWPKAGKSS